MVVAVLGSFTFLLLGFYVDPLALWLGLVPLDEWDWGQVAICLLIHFVITEVLKFSVRCQLYSILKQYFLFRTFKVKKPEIQEFQPTSPGLV
ncbi:hypothetical protein HMI55_001555 [Coelomomyces lativittatus]|nr:hypothetical protein HMI55_001555 [Coelomomyces lativittatus]